jgi:hypothetical protein
MHWLSFIAVLMIVSICQAQPSSSFKNPDPHNNNNKAGTFNVVSSGNGADASGSKNGADGFVRVTTATVASGSFMKQEKDGQNTYKFVANSGNYNQCYFIVPIFIAAFTAMIHF